MLRVVQFSGGKDSTALVLWAREQFGADGFTAVFCDTKWEHPLTYAYVQHINETVLGGKLVTLVSDKYPGGMVEMVKDRKRVPSPFARFCTQELKVFPFRDWLRTQTDEAVVYQGIRADESGPRRAAGCRLFSDVYDCWIERPLFDWSAERVFEMHRKHQVSPNPLYLAGCARVGCFPCISMGLGEIRRINHTMPEMWDRIEVLNQAANGRGFFPATIIPERFHSQRNPNSGETFPSAEDVRKYIESAEADQLRMWDKCSSGGCMSVYNLCE